LLLKARQQIAAQQEPQPRCSEVRGAGLSTQHAAASEQEAAPRPRSFAWSIPGTPQSRQRRMPRQVIVRCWRHRNMSSLLRHARASRRPPAAIRPAKPRNRDERSVDVAAVGSRGTPPAERIMQKRDTAAAQAFRGRAGIARLRKRVSAWRSRQRRMSPAAEGEARGKW